jgi:hypothetical protein
MGEARANCGGEDVAGAHAEDDVLLIVTDGFATERNSLVKTYDVET